MTGIELRGASLPTTLAIGRLTAFTRQLGAGFLPYLLVSLAALAVDFAVYMGVATAGPRPGAAAAVGWAIGLFAHYLLARHFLYTSIAPSDSTKARIASFLVYSLPSVAGLAITVGTVEMLVWAGFSLALAKAYAAGFSFVIAFVVRDLMYRGQRPGAA